MRIFSEKRPHSGLVAKERLATLLAAERLNCSPQSLDMLKNDLIAAAEKYLVIEPEQISISISQTNPAVLIARIPMKPNEEYHVKAL